MSATSPKSIVSDVAYPGAAATRSEQEDGHGQGSIFTWAEDALFAWRGAAAFGVLVFLLGMVYWLGATGYDGFTDGPLLVLFLLCFLGAAFVAFVGRTEVALAFLGTALLTGVLAVLDPPYLISTPGVLFSSSPTVGPDLTTVVALWVAGGALAVLGAVQAFRTSREIDSDE